MKMQPAYDWIWVDLDEGQIHGEVTSSGGVILQGDNKSSNGLVRGTVVAVGHGKYSANGNLIPNQAKTGDRVLFTKSIALQNKVELDGAEYILIRDENIMAFI